LVRNPRNPFGRNPRNSFGNEFKGILLEKNPKLPIPGDAHDEVGF
jgi:hypothetical protein